MAIEGVGAEQPVHVESSCADFLRTMTSRWKSYVVVGGITALGALWDLACRTTQESRKVLMQEKLAEYDVIKNFTNITESEKLLPLLKYVDVQRKYENDQDYQAVILVCMAIVAASALCFGWLEYDCNKNDEKSRARYNIPDLLPATSKVDASTQTQPHRNPRRN